MRSGWSWISWLPSRRPSLAIFRFEEVVLTCGEQHGVEYVIGLANNQCLRRIVGAAMH